MGADRPICMGAIENAGIDTDATDGLHWAGVVLATVTGVIHLLLAWFQLSDSLTAGLGWAFLFAGVVFLAAGVGVLVEYRRRLLYLLGIPFTAGQIVLWYLANAPDLISPISVADKLAQVGLLVVLVVLLPRE